VQETNCHPFRHGKWLFVHNGEIFGIEKVRRELLMAVDAALFGETRSDNPDIRRVLGEQARAVVSEPIGKFAEIWTEVPQSSALRM
jgi:predicted glutamine amidotransferase